MAILFITVPPLSEKHSIRSVQLSCDLILVSRVFPYKSIVLFRVVLIQVCLHKLCVGFGSCAAHLFFRLGRGENIITSFAFFNQICPDAGIILAVRQPKTINDIHARTGKIRVFKQLPALPDPDSFRIMSFVKLNRRIQFSLQFAWFTPAFTKACTTPTAEL